MFTNDAIKDMERVMQDRRSYSKELLAVIVSRAAVHAQLQQTAELARLNDNLQNSLQVIAKVLNK